MRCIPTYSISNIAITSILFHRVILFNVYRFNILVFSMGNLRLHNRTLFLLLLKYHLLQINRGVAVHSHQSFSSCNLASCVHHSRAARMTHLLLRHQCLKKLGKRKIMSKYNSQYLNLVSCALE